MKYQEKLAVLYILAIFSFVLSLFTHGYAQAQFNEASHYQTIPIEIIQTGWILEIMAFVLFGFGLGFMAIMVLMQIGDKI